MGKVTLTVGKDHKNKNLSNMATNFRKSNARNDAMNARSILERIYNIKFSPFRVCDTDFGLYDRETRLGAEVVTHFSYNHHINIEASEYLLPVSINAGKIDLNKLKAISNPTESLLHFCEKRHMSYVLDPCDNHKLDLDESESYNIVKLLSYSTPYEKNVARATYRLFVRNNMRTDFKSQSGKQRETTRRKLMWSNIVDTSNYWEHDNPTGWGPVEGSPRRVSFDIPGDRFEAQVGFGLPSVSSIIAGDTLDNVNNLVAQMQEFMPQVQENSAKFHEVLTKINDMLSHENETVVKDYIKENIDKLQSNNDLRSISDDTLKGLSLAAFVSACCFAFYSRSNGSYALLAASTVGVVYFYRDRITDIVPLLAKATFVREEPTCDMFEAQTAIDSNDFITLIATTLMGMSIKGSNAINLPQNVIKHIGDFSRIKDNLEKIFTFIVELIGKILDSLGCPDFLPESVKNFHITDKDILDIIKRTSEIRKKQLAHTFNVGNENYNLITDLMSKCHSVLMHYKGKERTHSHVVVNRHLTMLEVLEKQFREANFDCDGLRMEPACLLIAGGPGTLKSSAMYHFSEAFSSFVLTDDEKNCCTNLRDKYIFNRVVENVYWDGMTPEKRIIMFDDFGQIRDSVGSGDNEFMNMIRAVNEFEFSPHMAELGSKGSTKFRAKAVIATSNMTDWSIESIVQPEAVYRRFDKAYIAIPKPKHELNPGVECNMNKKFDMSTLPIGSKGITSVAPDVLLFVEYDLINKKETGICKTFEEVVDVFKQIFDMKVLRFEQKCLELKEVGKYYEKKYATTPATYEDIFEKKDSSCSLEAQSGFDFSHHPKIDPEVLSQTNARLWKDQSIPFIVRLDDECGKLTEAYYKYVFDSFDTGTDVYSCVKMQDFFVKVNKGIGSRGYHDVVMLYAFIKMYGTEFLKHLDSDMTIDELYYEYPINLELIGRNSPQVRLNVSVTSSIISSYYSLQRFIKDSIYTPVCKHLMNFCKWTEQNQVLWFSLCAGVGFVISAYINSPTRVARKAQYGYNLRKGNVIKTKEISRRAANKPGITESQYNWGQDYNGENIVEKILKNNVYTLSHRSKTDDTTHKLGYVTFVKAEFCLVPKHFHILLDDKVTSGLASYDDFIEFTRVNGGKEQRKCIISVREFLSNSVSTTNMDTNDICLVKCPPSLRNHKNIVKNFPMEATVTNIKDMKGKLYVPNEDWAQCQNVVVRKMTTQTVHLNNDIAYDILNGYEYDAHTQKGDCGSLLAIMNSKIQDAKVFGIHTAGQTANKVGFASSVNREMLDEALAEFGEDVIDEPMYKEAQSGTILGDGRFTELYDVEKPMHSSGKSSIIKSILHSSWKESSLMPAKLSPFEHNGVKIDPMKNALSKYCSPAIYFSSEIMEQIGCDIYDFLENVSTNRVDRRLLTYRESIVGIEGEPLFASISRKTSPGYPWIKERKGGIGKFYIFGSDQEYCLANDEAKHLERKVRKLIDDASHGIRNSIIFSDNLKDETRPIKKVLAGKTRLFSGCPIDYLLAFRMYFGSFSLWFMQNRIVNHSAIGVNPYSDEWHRIARYLLRNGDHNDLCIGAGDYGAFDGSEKSHIHWLIYDIAQKWYNDGSVNARIRRVLWSELVQSKHINGKTVYQWDSSLPSGHPWTIIVNGIYNEFAFRYCWAKTVKFDRVLMHDFDKHVYVIFMGDDNAFSVSPKWRKLYNEMTLAVDMKDLGLDYTTEHKLEAIVPLRRIGEIDFLKRSFVINKSFQRYVAPLQLDVVLEIPFWTKTHDSRTITEDNCDTTIKELALHGKDVFDEYVPKIVSAMIEHLGHGPTNSSYDVALNTILDSEFMY